MKKLIVSAVLASAYVSGLAADPTMTPKDGYPRFALGADVSRTPYIENNRVYTFYKGTEITAEQVTNVPEMLNDYGVDAVRLRVWVNPFTEAAINGFSYKVDGASYTEMSTYGTCSIDEMVNLAKRLAKNGQRVMVSFQMSDQWADPEHQFIPEAWEGCSNAEELAEKAASHITEVLTLLHDANVNVAWAQIGNETNNGMMEWEVPANGQEVTVAPYGCQIYQKAPNVPTETTYNFVKVFNACADAAKALYPNVKTVMHVTHGARWTTMNWTLNLLKQAGFFTNTKCDYIGVSLYPGNENGKENYTADWKVSADQGLTTLQNIYKTYGVRTILCEIGMNNEYSLSTPQSEINALGKQAAYIRQCSTDVSAFTQYLIDNLGGDDSTCDGLFYWEPETDYMKGYGKGACVSATPSDSWPRDKVTANGWWHTIKENSTFPAGGLVEFRISDDTIPDFVPDPELKLYIYYYDTDNRFEPMETADGLLYKLTGFSAPQWFNFKISSEDWSIALGNAEVGLNQEGYLNNKNDWMAWTSTSVSSSDYWWYRHDTHAMTITSDDTCPWPNLNTSISSILKDNQYGETEYYNLQGMRVYNPGHGIYIMRTGQRVQKVRL